MTALPRSGTRRSSGTAFRCFWLGQSVSFFGTQVTLVALPLVAVLILDASAADMGLIVAAQTVPNLLGPAVLGDLVDRFDRRRLLLVADYGRLISLAVVPAAYAAGLLNTQLLLAVAFSLGTFTVLNDIAYFSLLPALISPAELVRANARMEGTRSVSQVVGPGVGGVLTQVLSAANALAVDVASYAYSVVQLHRMKTMTPPEPPCATRQPWYSGLREVWYTPALRLLAAGSGGFNFFSAGAIALVALFLVNEIGLSPALYGFGVAIGGVGGVVSASFAHRLVARLGPRTVLSGSLVLCGASEATLVVIREPGPLAFGLIAGSEFLAVAGVTLYIVVNAAIRQRIIPAELRGRVFAAMRLIARGLMPIGGVAGGFVAQLVGIRAAIAMVAIGQLLIAVVFVTRRGVLPASTEDEEWRSTI